MADVNINAGEVSSVRLNEQASDVSTPAAGYWSLYAKANGPYAINEAGSVSGLFVPGICQGRLTLETGVAVSTADQTAKTSVYFTPYNGNLIGLYNGSDGWDILAFSELSLSLASYTADKNYDIWVYNNSGAAALDSTIWTNDTTRATALALQDGIYVKTGATTRRYVGTIRITATTGQCEDSDANRYIWNYYNRVNRRNYLTEGTAHDYTTGAWRYWNNSSAQNIKFVTGVAEELSQLVITSYMDGTGCYVGFDEDAATAGDVDLGYLLINSANNASFNYSAVSSKIFTAGYHFLAILEYGGANGSFVRMNAQRLSRF